MSTSGSPTRRTHPPALGSASGPAPKQASRVRSSHSGAAAPAGYSASAHQVAVTARIMPSATTASPGRARAAIPAYPTFQITLSSFQFVK